MMNGAVKPLAIWVYRDSIDFRKQMNGCIEIVMDEMKRQPNDGCMYVFRNRNRDKLKVLVWDRNGFWMLYKRLEKGRFDFSSVREGCLEITMDDYDMLISGMPILRLGKPRKTEFR